jgi:menaquinone-dependent protoporphyrinogen oxidase
VGRYRDALTKLPVAAFGVGVVPVGKDPTDRNNAMKKLHKIFYPLNPVAETIFAGKVDMAKLPFFQNWIWGKAKGPVGDFRDWDAIARWAKDLPGMMKM